MQSWNQSEIIQQCWPQIAGELMHLLHRFFHQPLRACDLLRETTGAARSLPRQCRQLDIDAHQGLDDFIMQIAADAHSFLLLCLQNSMRQVPQLSLHVTGLLQRPALVSLAFLERFLHRLPPHNFPVQLQVGVG